MKGYFWIYGNLVGYSPEENAFFYVEIGKGKIKTLKQVYILPKTKLRDRF